MTAEKNEASETSTTSSLKDFSLDDGPDFFGIKTGGSSTNTLIEQVKHAGLEGFDEDIEDDGTPTNLEELDKKTPAKEPEIEAGRKPIKKVETKRPVVEEEEEEVKLKKGKAKPEVDPEEEIEEEEVKFFEDETTKKVVAKKKEEEEIKGESEVITPDPEDYFTNLASDLKDRGIFANVELKEDEKIDEDKFFELHDAEIEARVDETIDALFEDFDQEGKDFIKFKKNGGGSTLDFMNQYFTPFTMETLDEENSEQRQKVIKHYLTTVEKVDSEDLEDRMAFIKEGGKEKAIATKYFNKLNDLREANKKTVLESAAAKRQQEQENAKNFAEGLVSVAATTENVGMFPISKIEQKELPVYITKPNVKVGKNKYIPAFSSELGRILRAETPKDQQDLLVLAKLIKNKFKIDDLKVKTETTVTKEAKSRIAAAKSGVKAHSSGDTNKKALSDYFPD